MKNKIKIQRMVGIAILAALVVVLQFISNYIPTAINPTFALVPVAVGAILYGPVAGLALGMVLGVIVLVAPGTQGFIAYNVFATIVLCLVKTGLAGFISGWLFKLFAFIANKNEKRATRITLIIIGTVISTMIIPVINTSIFLLGTVLFFVPYFENVLQMTIETKSMAFKVIMGLVFTTNFTIEFWTSAILSPAVITIIKVLTKKSNLGFANDFSVLNEESEN